MMLSHCIWIWTHLANIVDGHEIWLRGVSIRRGLVLHTPFRYLPPRYYYVVSYMDTG